MSSFLLWWAGALTGLLALTRYSTGAWATGVDLIALLMVSPLLAGALWLRITKYHGLRARAEQWGHAFGERHRDQVRGWFTRK